MDISQTDELELVTLDREPKNAGRIAQLSLLREAHAKLKDYSRDSTFNFSTRSRWYSSDDTVQWYKTYLAPKSPTRRNLKSLKTWLQSERPLNGQKSGYLEQGYDYIALHESQDSGTLDLGVAYSLDYCLPKRVRKLCCLQTIFPARTDDPFEVFHDQTTTSQKYRR